MTLPEDRLETYLHAQQLPEENPVRAAIVELRRLRYDVGRAYAVIRRMEGALTLKTHECSALRDELAQEAPRRHPPLAKELLDAEGSAGGVFAAGALAQEAEPVVHGTTLWLWKHGEHYLAFRHLYPCFTPGGDPQTLGEPVGWAEFRESHDRAGKGGY